MFEIIITAGLLIFILWVLFSRHKTTERNTRVINMSVFSIGSIDDFIREADLLDVFRGMHLKGWNRFMYGDPYVALEKVIQNGKTEYYIAIPKKYEELLVRNPNLKKTDHEVLPENKDYCAVRLHRKRPLVRFAEFGLHENEGMALQVLARHLHPIQSRGALRALAALFGIHDGQGRFESNVRVVSWADSPGRASKILGLENGDSRAGRRTVFDFFSRIFENDRRMRLSFGDLKDLLINKFVY